MEHEKYEGGMTMESPDTAGIRFDTREEKGWTIWSLSGSMDVFTSPEIDEEGQKVLTIAEKLVVDLANVEYLSSAGLRVLVRLGKRAKKEGKGYAIASAQGMAACVLKESHMNMLVPMMDSLEDLE